MIYKKCTDLMLCSNNGMFKSGAQNAPLFLSHFKKVKRKKLGGGFGFEILKTV